MMAVHKGYLHMCFNLFLLFEVEKGLNTKQTIVLSDNLVVAQSQ